MRLEHSPTTYWIRSNGVRFLDNSLTLEYAGEGGNVQDCAVAQANFPMSITNHYFELEIIDGGAGCSIAIGLAKLTYPLHRHPGWNPGAIGYHADDGKVFQEVGLGRQYGPTCGVGDVMGCGVRFGAIEFVDDSGSESDTSIPSESIGGGFQFDQGRYYSDSDEEEFDEGGGFHFGGGGGLFGGMGYRPIQGQAAQKKPTKSKEKERKVTVYFTKNGEYLEDIECELPSGGFYPVVAMLSRGEKIKVNLYPLSG